MQTKTRRREREDDHEVNLTPMLDVVFIMLIFFIVTASLVKEYGLDASQQAGASNPVTDDEQLLVRISAEDEIRIEQRLVDPRALKATIARAAAEGRTEIVVLAEPRSSNRTLVNVMDASRQAGVYNIAIAENPEAMPGARALPGSF